MSEILERLVNDREPSESKSYLIGLERGRVWAEEYADYFEIREWAELEDDGDLILPSEEDFHLRLLMRETTVEPEAYVRGWLAGVKEMLEQYQRL